ncbi:MAG: GNAT family N-acetyltransferase [Acidimicrobiia bacterium]|nr:GNAT family N-acetyltransferase [Acidimicrobiia bacterium]
MRLDAPASYRLATGTGDPPQNPLVSNLVDEAKAALEHAHGDTVREALGDAGVAALFAAVAAEWGDDCLQYLSSQLTAAEAVDLLDRFQRNRVRAQTTVGRVSLAPLEEQAYRALYRASLDPRSSFRWRYRGTTPEFSYFVQSLFAGTKAQYLVQGRDSHTYGLVAAYSDQADLGHCYIGFLRCSDRKPQGEMHEGMFLFIDYLFNSTSYRKLYVEIPQYNEDEIGLTQLGPFVIEGCLKEHDFHGGKLFDRLILALYRESWDSWAEPYRAIL